MLRARCREKVQSLSEHTTSQVLKVFTNWKLSCQLGLLWRFPDIGMID